GDVAEVQQAGPADDDVQADGQKHSDADLTYQHRLPELRRRRRVEQRHRYGEQDKATRGARSGEVRTAGRGRDACLVALRVCRHDRAAATSCRYDEAATTEQE